MPVELAGIGLAHLTRITTAEEVRLVRHRVPGMSGDLVQGLGRASVDMELAGVFYGATAPDELDRLRRAHAAVEPVELFIQAVDESETTQTLSFSEVVIEALAVEQRVGAPGEFAYACRIVEYVPPPAPVAADVLGAIDTGILDEAAASIDSVQDALAEVSALADLVANVPSFGNPTEQLPAMLDRFTSTVGDAAQMFGELRDALDAPE